MPAFLAPGRRTPSRTWTPNGAQAESAAEPHALAEVAVVTYPQDKVVKVAEPAAKLPVHRNGLLQPARADRGASAVFVAFVAIVVLVAVIVLVVVVDVAGAGGTRRKHRRPIVVVVLADLVKTQAARDNCVCQRLRGPSAVVTETDIYSIGLS